MLLVFFLRVGMVALACWYCSVKCNGCSCFYCPVNCISCSCCIVLCSISVALVCFTGLHFTLTGRED